MIDNAFLRQVAEYYVHEDRVELLKDRTFIFPSKRACTFFLRYLSDIVKANNKVILAPRCTTVNEFILGLMPSIMPLDRTELLFKLYDQYCAVHGAEAESFDSFLFWGDIMLKDFDLIDRYMVDSDQLYHNLFALKELDTTEEVLSEELKIVIETYWKSYKEKKGVYREKFLAFWESLGEVYKGFQAQLDAEQIGYEGYIYKKVAESAVDLVDELAKGVECITQQRQCAYIFVGLFEFSKSELRLLKRMRNRGIAEFVWDESNCVAQDPKHGAYKYIERNKGMFSSVNYLPSIEQHKPTDYLPESIKVYKCTSTMTEMKALPQIINQLQEEQAQPANDLDTAIILPNEQLLIPTVSAIPDNYQDLNITLGYPLNKTNISLMLNRWMRFLLTEVNGAYPVPELINLFSLQLFSEHYPGLTIIADMLRKQRNYMLSAKWILDTFVAKRVKEEDKPAVEAALPLARNLLLVPQKGLDFSRANDFLTIVRAILQQIAEPLRVQALEESLGEGRVCIGWELTFLMHYEKLTNRLEGLIAKYEREDFSREGVVHLLDGLTSGYTIPFKGDPLKGLQVMGLLESRSLHFNKLIYLSAQDGSLPKGKAASTFIPYELRKAFGIPTSQEEDIAEAYRFYQSISCCRYLIMVYSTASDAPGSKGEASRYISQMQMIYGANIDEISVDVPSDRVMPQPIVIEKDEQVQKQLSKFIKGRSEPIAHLSASSLNMYLQCPLRFYYTYVCNAKEENKVEELMQANDFGTIMHSVMQEFYNRYRNKSVEADTLRSYIEGSRKDELRQLVESVYTDFFTKEIGNKFVLHAGDEIHIDTIYQYALNILRFDLQYTPFTYIASEDERKFFISITIDGQMQEVAFTGSIDRVDEVYSEEQGGIVRRIIDYKSGRDENEKIKSIESIFENVKTFKAAIQMLLYSEMMREASKNPIYPTLYAFRSLNHSDYNPYLQWKDNGGGNIAYEDVREEYMSIIRERLEELFSKDKPFVQCEKHRYCEHCPFKLICNR